MLLNGTMKKTKAFHQMNLQLEVQDMYGGNAKMVTVGKHKLQLAVKNARIALVDTV